MKIWICRRGILIPVESQTEMEFLGYQEVAKSSWKQFCFELLFLQNLQLRLINV